MSPLRLNGSTSGFSQLDAPAIAGDQTFTLPGTGGTIDRLNRAGNILQVVNASTGTQVTNSTSTYIDTGLTATITPTSASSKVLVLVNQNGCYKEVSHAWNRLKLLANGSDIVQLEAFGGATGTSTANEIGSISTAFLHSPSTTSAVTYKTQFQSGNNNAIVFTQVTSGGNASTSTITLMEVAA